MDNEKIQFGVYIHKTNSSLAYAFKPENYDDSHWVVDKGEYRKHPFLRLKAAIVAQGTGSYFFNKVLKHYELIDNEV